MSTLQHINYDLDLCKFFTDSNHKIYLKPSKDQWDLNREIYFSPSYCPQVSMRVSELGSCFEGLTIPTASWIYSGHGTRELVKTDLDLDTYIETIYQNVSEAVSEVYRQHDQVYLFFSGGIDSMVLLSFVLKLGFGSRTHLISIQNHTQAHPTALSVNADSRRRIEELYQSHRDKLQGFTWHPITRDDLIDTVNHGSFADLKCYTTYQVLKQYNNQAFIFGHHGNPIFLHKHYFLDQIVLKNPNFDPDHYNQLRTQKRFYTAEMSNYEVPQDPKGIVDRYLAVKPWTALNGLNSNKVYAPFGSNSNFQLLRSLDFSNFDPWYVMDAVMARTVIHRNVGDSFDPYIDQESIQEYENLVYEPLPTDRLNLDSFDIPQNLRHCQEGLDYLQHELGTSRSSGQLPLNAIVSIRSLQYIANTY